MEAPLPAGVPLSLAMFSGVVGGRFQIDAERAGRVEVELVEATALPAARGGRAPDREPFSLVFLGPPLPLLCQRIYRFEHEALGSLEIFIVPIGKDELGVRYQAIFN